LVHGLQQRQAVLHEHLAGCGGREAARMALKQRFAKRVFQLADAAARSCQRQMRAARAAAVRLPVWAQATARRMDTRSKRARL
jgi:hypothetical protein